MITVSRHTHLHTCTLLTRDFFQGSTFDLSCTPPTSSINSPRSTPSPARFKPGMPSRNMRKRQRWTEMLDSEVIIGSASCIRQMKIEHVLAVRCCQGL